LNLSNQSIGVWLKSPLSRHAIFLRAACVASAGTGKLGKLGSIKKN